MPSRVSLISKMSRAIARSLSKIASPGGRDSPAVGRSKTPRSGGLCAEMRERMEQRQRRKGEALQKRIERANKNALHQAARVEAKRPAQGRVGGKMSKGELYEYFKRTGRLEVFFAMFPGP